MPPDVRRNASSTKRPHRSTAPAAAQPSEADEKHPHLRAARRADTASEGPQPHVRNMSHEVLHPTARLRPCLCEPPVAAGYLA